MQSARRFHVELPVREIANRLWFAYRYVVEEICEREFEGDNNTKAHILELAEFLANPGTNFGVALTGDCGNGKSTLMRAFQRVLNELNYEDHFKSFMVPEFKAGMRIIPANDIIDRMDDREWFEDLKWAWMLGIDDFGEEPREVLDFGNAKYPLTRLIEFRYDHRLFTFITTNLDGDKMLERYKERIYDRMMEMFRFIAYDPGSYR